MSLHLIQETTPIAYELCQPGDGAVYHPELCTPPRIYRETVSGLGTRGFWYDSKTDEYVAYIAMDFTLWPSYRTNLYRISPETGLLNSEILAFSGTGGGLTGYENGGFNKLYAYSNNNGVFEVDTQTLNVIGSPIVPMGVTVSSHINPFIINQSTKTLVVDDTLVIEVWDYTAGSEVQLGEFGNPQLSLSDMAYEDDQRVWTVAIGADGLPTVIKLNYQDIKIESMSAIQAGTEPDLGIFIAYDSLRKVVAVLRMRPDAVDGAARHVVELYKPFAVPTNISAPVPVGPLVPGKVTTFVANMYGDRGEMGQLKTVTVTNTGDGTILQPTVTPRTNGSIVFQYLSGPNPGTDTIQIQADF